MPIQYNKKRVVFSEVASVEDTEALLEWLQKHPGARIDLAACTHLHPANLQVLAAGRVTVSAWPADAGLADWLRPLLQQRHGAAAAAPSTNPTVEK